jgi:hypothetical protein
LSAALTGQIFFCRLESPPTEGRIEQQGKQRNGGRTLGTYLEIKLETLMEELFGQ